jgi:hypothetical protein
MELCPTEIHHQGGTHYRPRKAARRRTRLVREWRQAQQEYRQAKSAPQQTEPSLEHLQETSANLRAQISKLDKEHMTLAAQAQREKDRRLLDEKQRLASRKILNTATTEGPRGTLTALAAPDGTVTAKASRIIEIVEGYYKKLMSAPSGCKTGLYMPSEATRDYPHTQGPDPFTLESCVKGPRKFLHQGIADQHLFDTCLSTLSSGKAPGPDELVNEVIKLLPKHVHSTIHNLFQIKE